MATVTLPGIGAVERKYVYAGAAVVAGIVGYTFLMRRGGSSAVVADPSGGSLGDGSGGSPISGGAPSSTTPIDTDPGLIDTDAEWTEDVVQRLSMTWEPSFVITALGRWMAGLPLSPEEADLVRAALALRGHPPSGARPIILAKVANPPSSDPAKPPEKTKPPEKAKPAPAKPKRYTVKSGDTLSRIASLYGHPGQYGQLYAANASVIEAEARRRGRSSADGPGGSKGWWIFPGTELTIPW